MDNREYAKALKHYSMALNVKEVSEILRISTKLVYRLIREGRIPAIKVGRENRISKLDLINYMKGQNFRQQ